MKSIIIYLGIVLSPILAFSQKNKFFVEFGGNYSKSLFSDFENGEGNSLKKETSIIPAIGYSLTNRISIGLQYQYINTKTSESNLLGGQYYQASTQYSLNEKMHHYGAILRYNINNPLSKFNFFANLNPSIIQSKSEFELFSMSQNIINGSTTSSFSTSEGNQDISGYSIRLGIGLSYQFYKRLAVQYQLINLASIHSDKSPSLFTEAKTTNTKSSFFNKPLENSFLSLKYTF